MFFSLLRGYEKIMELVNSRTLMNILATIVGVLAIILIAIFPNQAPIIFSIEVIILPTIYIIGNSYIEEKIKQEYQNLVSDISEDSERLKQRYINAMFVNQELHLKLNQKRKQNGRKTKKD